MKIPPPPPYVQMWAFSESTDNCANDCGHARECTFALPRQKKPIHGMAGLALEPAVSGVLVGNLNPFSYVKDVTYSLWWSQGLKNKLIGPPENA